jgi:hypothetical protein
MAGYQALAAVGRSITTLLQKEFVVVPDGERPKPKLVRASDFDDVGTPGAVIRFPCVAVYCYRLTVDRETRPGWSAVASYDGIPRIPLRMHMLISAWDTDVEKELQWLGLTASILETNSILTGPQLDPSGEWDDGDAIQIVTDEIPLESLSEAFQAFTTRFRCAMFYVGRVIVLAGPEQGTAERVTTVTDRVETLGS